MMRKVLGLTLLALVIASGPSAALELLFGLTQEGEILTIDRFTGAGSFYGYVPYNGGDALEADGGYLLGIIDGNALIRYDIVTGEHFPVGDTDSICKIEALAWRNDILLAAADPGCDSYSDRLVSIDPSTGAATLIGPFGGGWVDVDGLATLPSGQLLGTTLGGTTEDRVLLDIDPETGEASYVATLGTRVTGLDCSLDGTLFGATILNGYGGPSDLVIIDPVTGDLTWVGPIGYNTVIGLVFASVPVSVEESSWGKLKTLY